jgi:hypothetical protein
LSNDDRESAMAPLHRLLEKSLAYGGAQFHWSIYYTNMRL